MTYYDHWQCPPCGKPPYPGERGPGPWGPGRPPYSGPGGPGPERPPYPGPWGPPPPPEPNRRNRKCPNRHGPCGHGLRGMETMSQMEEDLYMADMQEPGEMEEDWLYMKQLYPNTARKLVPYIEDAADRMEYENSLMFDGYPDRVAVEQIVREIIAAVQENEPALLQRGEVVEEGAQDTDQTWHHCVEEMIQIMLLSEMHHRRWRYQKMNRKNC